jgi:hypothetical protein
LTAAIIICDFGACQIGCVINFGFYVESGSGGYCCDKLADGLGGEQWFAAPGLGD